MEELTKAEKDTIGTLYALRAGLSIASDISDKANVVKEEIDEISKDIIPNLNKDIKELEDFAEEEKNAYLLKIENKRQELLKIEKTFSGINEGVKTDGIVCLILIATFLVSIGLRVVLGENDFGFPILFWLIRMVLLAFAIGSIVCLVKFAKNNQEKWEESEESLNAEETVLSSLRNQLTELIDCKNEEVEKITQKYNRKIRLVKEDIKCNQVKLSERKAVFDLEKSKFFIVYNSLKEQFLSFLDERDWRNVDLIIYFYETGRALDLRDALLQVDLERRNERLVKALEYATNEISRNILNGFGEMRLFLNNKLDILNRRIVSSISDVNRKVVELISSNRALEGKLQEISKISSAQEALQKKISISSDAMADDIQYMKELAERTYYGT